MGGSPALRGPALREGVSASGYSVRGLMEGACVIGSASTAFFAAFFGEPARMMVSSSGGGAASTETESKFGSVGGSGSTVWGSEWLPSSAQKASNTSWHLPQRTWPWAALSCAELTRNFVLQFVQTVNIFNPTYGCRIF